MMNLSNSSFITHISTLTSPLRSVSFCLISALLGRVRVFHPLRVLALRLVESCTDARRHAEVIVVLRRKGHHVEVARCVIEIQVGAAAHGRLRNAGVQDGLGEHEYVAGLAGDSSRAGKVR